MRSRSCPTCYGIGTNPRCSDSWHALPEQPTAAVIEIFQTSPERTDDTLAGSVIVPDRVCINGHPVLTQGGIKVHEINIPLGMHSELLQVTVTLLARRVIIAAKGDVE
jgi:hypothetical protein